MSSFLNPLPDPVPLTLRPGTSAVEMENFLFADEPNVLPQITPCGCADKHNHVCYGIESSQTAQKERKQMSPAKKDKKKDKEPRVHILMSKEEQEALDKYCEKEYPGASRAYVIRLLIEKGIKQ